MTFQIVQDVPIRAQTARKFFPQIFAAVTATFFGISNGMTYGWTSPMVPYLISDESHIKTNLKEAEWLELILLCGCLSAIPFTLFSVEKFGRKRSLIFATMAALTQWLLIGLGDQMIYLFIGRFIAGLSSNMGYVACPLYIAEISDKRIRGSLSTITTIMEHIGTLTIYSLGPITSFYTVPILGSTVVLLQLLLLTLIPESPFFLMIKTKEIEASKAVEWLKPYEDVTIEIKHIAKTIESNKTEKIGIKDLFMSKINRKVLAIIFVLNFGSQLLGYVAIIMNLHLILEEAGSVYMSSLYAGVLYASIMLIASVICSLFIDRFGRKVLLIISSSVSGLCVLTLAIYFHLKQLRFDVIPISWIPIATVMIFALFFKIGIGVIPVILTAEIAPRKIKSLGLVFGDSLWGLGSLVGVQIYQFFGDYEGIYFPFYLYFLSSLILIVFICIFVPETKGKTLDEIEAILNGENVEKKENI